MGQLTISRFRGDTAFGFVSRIFSTFFGGLVGLIMWFVTFMFDVRLLAETSLGTYRPALDMETHTAWLLFSQSAFHFSSLHGCIGLVHQ
jgi:hypothetical protein